ncbi:diablo homolog, mitochondrial-like [Acanthaster planci]|uniref:Direct IAP-binding protein with low pI n=1 Tax=Acanthaster planci TaxID=133434 RepID=A0A8B7ZJ76_ACAPL|nr:diablo homolog, mitochondrial-like [Acanthaster planci]
MACRGLKRFVFCERFWSVLYQRQAVCIPSSHCLQPPRVQATSLLRPWLVRLCGLGTGGVLLSAIPCVPLSSNDKHSSAHQGSATSLQSDAGSLSHHELIKNAAAIAVDSSCILLTHSALAAISLRKEYAEMVTSLRLLLEDHAQFVGTPAQEDDLWQDIIHQRVEIDNKMQAIEDANVMLTSAILVVERAAEAAYQADAELSALTAGQHLQLVQAQLAVASKVSQKAKEQLATMQAQMIKAAAADGGDSNLEEVPS